MMTHMDMINMNIERYLFQVDFMEAGSTVRELYEDIGREVPPICDWKPTWPHPQWVAFGE